MVCKDKPMDELLSNEIRDIGNNDYLYEHSLIRIQFTYIVIQVHGKQQVQPVNERWKRPIGTGNMARRTRHLCPVTIPALLPFL